MSTSGSARIDGQGLSALKTMTDGLLQAGMLPLEARLLAERYTSGVVHVSCKPDPALIGAARWEGLAIWENELGFGLAGSFTAFRTLLAKWPQSMPMQIGQELAQLLAMPCKSHEPVPWPGAAPQGWGQRPVVMGILNVTPDSFSDGGRYCDPAAAVDRALAMVDEGADIIDIGGESTRPGAAEVPAEEELARVVPVVRAVASRTSTPISVDTYKPAVAAAAIDAGAAIINDISGLQDPAMIELAARTGVPAIVMHMQGVPHTMQQNPQYKAVVGEVLEWLRQTCDRALQAGVRPGQLIIDPGIGFGKTTAHNLELMNRLSDLRGLGYPVLLGTSRKSVIGNVLGLPVDQRLEGTAATVALAVREHTEIIRVHDVRPIRRVVDMSQAIVAQAALQ